MTAAQADGAAAALAADLVAQSGAPGGIVAIDRAGARDVAVAGRRSLEADDLIRPTDLWHLGSNAKSMTATLVARLAEAGVIGWEDTVGQVLGPRIPGMDAGYADVTYADLLAHRAGVGANIGLLSALSLSGPAAGRDLAADRLRYAAIMLSKPPGPKEFAYSNAGYVVAGAMLEVSTGQTWEDLMRAHVFAPLGLDSVGFGAPGVAGVVDQPRGHNARLFGLRSVDPGPKADNIAALGPAGTVHMAAEDVLDYLGAHLRRDLTFLSAGSWARLHQPAPGQDYVSGWNVRPDGTLMHAGSNTMWLAKVYVVPDQQAVVFLAVNAGAIDAMRPAFDDIAARILGPLPD